METRYREVALRAKGDTVVEVWQCSRCRPCCIIELKLNEDPPKECEAFHVSRERVQADNRV